MHAHDALRYLAALCHRAPPECNSAVPDGVRPGWTQGRPSAACTPLKPAFTANFGCNDVGTGDRDSLSDRGAESGAAEWV